MPEPELTARRFTAIQQFSRTPCLACNREAFIDHHGVVVGHVDLADDKVCPELERRARMAEQAGLRLDNLRAALDAALDAPLQPDPPPVFSTRHQAEAYQARLRKINQDGWLEAIGNSVHQMALQHVQHLDQMLEAAPVGYRLCVHAAEWMGSVDTDFLVDNSMTLRLRQKVHVLGPGEACHALPSERTEYGPKR